MGNAALGLGGAGMNLGGIFANALGEDKSLRAMQRTAGNQADEQARYEQAIRALVDSLIPSIEAAQYFNTATGDARRDMTLPSLAAANARGGGARGAVAAAPRLGTILGTQLGTQRQAHAVGGLGVDRGLMQLLAANAASPYEAQLQTDAFAGAPMRALGQGLSMMGQGAMSHALFQQPGSGGGGSRGGDLTDLLLSGDRRAIKKAFTPGRSSGPSKFSAIDNSQNRAALNNAINRRLSSFINTDGLFVPPLRNAQAAAGGIASGGVVQPRP